MSITTSPCPRQQELVAATQTCLMRLADLARHQAEALANGNENLVMALDHQIETVLGEKERSLGALHQHRSEHGC